MKNFVLSLTTFLIAVLSILAGVVWFSSLGVAAEVEGLFLYLPFDEGDGAEAKDLSGNNFNGKLEGPQWVAGKFGNALQFDGDDFVVVDPLGVDPDEITIELFFSPAENIDSSDPRMDLVYAYDGCCRPHITFNNEGTGIVGFYGEFGEGKPNEGPKVWAVGPDKTSWDADTWYHFLATSDETETKVYLDGELVDEAPSPGEPVRVTWSEFGISIGANMGFNFFWSGRIDEFRVWSRVLTADEVKNAFDGTIMKDAAIEKKDKLAVTWGSIKKMR